MAIEEGGTGVVTETAPAVSGSASTGSTGTTQATSQPAPKWEDTPQYKGQIAELQKERKARQAYEQRQTELTAELNEWKRKTEALSGVRTPSQQETDDAAIQKRLEELGVPRWTEEDLQAFKEMREQSTQIRQFQEQHWESRHAALIAQVHADLTKELGDLSERQIKRINAAYVAEAEQNPEFMARISKGDKTAVQQFVKDYLEDVVEPVRRKQQADNANRFRPVPSGKDRSIAIPGEKPIDPKDNDAVMAMLVSSRKGQFGRNR